MKRFTLFIFAILIATFSWAQSPFAGKVSPQHVGKSAMQEVAALSAYKLQMTTTPGQAKKNAPKKAGTVVTPPEGEVVYYTLAGNNSRSSGITRTVKVIFDGSDIYVTGVSYYITDAWVKGTIDGSTITFASGQYLGSFQGEDLYFAGITDDGTSFVDVVATYDAETGNISFTIPPYIVDNQDPADGLGYYDYWTSLSLTKIEGEVDLPVEVPEGLETYEFFVKGISYAEDETTGALSGSEFTTTVQVGYVSTGTFTMDFYVKGLCSYLPDAWVKGQGVLDEGGNVVITFPSGQLFGTYANKYVMWFAGFDGTDDSAAPLDLVFNFDVASSTLTLADGQYVAINADKSTLNWYNLYSNLVISMPTDAAAMPANPSITALENGNYGYTIEFDVPIVDVEGNGLVTSKLFYEIYTDVEGEVSKMVFTPTTHSKLTEDLSTIPYGFTENYDFYKDLIYLNDLYSDSWNKIGIKSIYNGGDEVNETDIQWFDIKPYGTAVTTFDFNAMDVPTSSNSSTDGDITENKELTADNVTLVISPQAEGASTPNRFWSSTRGPQLRVYSGTLTFSVPEDYTIQGITFNAARWNASNSADSGTFDGSVWTGDAQNVVVSIAGNSQINSIDVTVVAVPSEDGVLVTLPDGVEPVEYTLNITQTGNSSSGEQNISREKTALVAFDGDDIYLSNLAYYFSSSYVKGKKNADGQYVFKSSQFVGEDDYGPEYIVGADASGVPADYIFNVDSESGAISLAEGFVLYESEAAGDVTNVYTAATAAVYTPGGVVYPDLVALPDGVVPESWTLEGTYSSSSNSDDVVKSVGVAFDGTDIYVQGLAYYFPESWIKGSIDEETGTATFPTGQFVGVDDDGPEYIVGYDGENVIDVVYSYNPDKQILIQTTKYVVENSKADAVAPWGYWENSVFYEGEPIEHEPVVVPDGLSTEIYTFSATELIFDDEETAPKKAKAPVLKGDLSSSKKKARTAIKSATKISDDYTTAPYNYQVEVGFAGNDVYIKGFTSDTKDFWLKGTLSDEGTVTIPANQYLGEVTALWFKFKYYVAAVNDEFTDVEDIVFNFDADTKTFTTDQTVVLHDNGFVLGEPYQAFGEIEIYKLNDVAATPADPTVSKVNLTGNYPSADFIVPTTDVDGNQIVTTKLFYTVWVKKDGAEVALNITPDQYQNVTAEMVEIPYTFDDSWDIYEGGSKFYFNQGADEIGTWEDVGIQSIYYGGDECNKSNIVWYSEVTGINNITVKKDSKDATFDLQGRRVAKPTKGLYIIGGKKVLVR